MGEADARRLNPLRRLRRSDALCDVSLVVRKGQFVAIVGPNGAGKTTLFKTISGIVRPNARSYPF